jgi:hypothetical protein
MDGLQLFQRDVFAVIVVLDRKADLAAMSPQEAVSPFRETHYGARFASSGRSKLLNEIKGLRRGPGLWRAV